MNNVAMCSVRTCLCNLLGIDVHGSYLNFKHSSGAHRLAGAEVNVIFSMATTMAD